MVPFENRLSIRLGYGRNTMLWDDICCGDTAFKHLCPDVHALAKNKRARADDCWKTNDGETTWEINILHSAQD